MAIKTKCKALVNSDLCSAFVMSYLEYKIPVNQIFRFCFITIRVIFTVLSQFVM